MSWQQRYRRASFRGVPFWVDSLETEAGRSTVLHEYPYRDEATYQDLGKNARRYSVEAFFIGDNYDTDRNAFLRVLEENTTPGLLIHPTYGEKQVVAISNARLSWRRTQPNFESLSITFAEVGPQPSPTTSIDRVQQLEQQATAADLALAELAASNLNTFGASPIAVAAQTLASTQATWLETVVNRAGVSVEQLSGWTSQLQRFKANVVSLVADPLQYVASSLNLISGVAPLVTTARQALILYQRLHTLLPPPNWQFTRTGVAPARIQTQTNTAVQNTLWRVTALTQASRQAVVIPYRSREAALAVRDTLIPLLQDELDALGNAVAIPAVDSLTQTIQQLQALTVAELTERALRLERFETITLSRPVPALVLAYDLYEDSDRADELVAENAVANPNSMPAAYPLRVLTA